jgi:16S rRNA (cytosine1402-N4)-methyltransferase
MHYHHPPAMPSEVVDYLNCQPGKTYADCTLGGAGHAIRICEKIVPGGTLVGIDQDLDAVENARNALRRCSARVHIVHDNFVNLRDILVRLGIPAVDGMLLDLGLSLHQIEASGRGFSFNHDEPLDMRMNTANNMTAEEIINRESEANLARIFEEYGEERRARSIARKIAYVRKKEAICSSRQLARIVIEALPAKARYGHRIHPATRVFMALRIAVNRELEQLREFLAHAADYLNPGGRLCVLSFHSLEDRIVKQRFVALARGCTCPPVFPQCVCGNKPVARIVTRKVVRPRQAEVNANPMARSTRLRVLEKLTPESA